MASQSKSTARGDIGFDWRRAGQRRTDGVTSASKGHLDNERKEKLPKGENVHHRKMHENHWSWDTPSLLPYSLSKKHKGYRNDLYEQEAIVNQKGQYMQQQGAWNSALSSKSWRNRVSKELQENGDVGKVIEIRSLAPPRKEDLECAKITDCEYAGSYNWINTKEPTIVIPGVPRMWKSTDKPCPLKQDCSQYFLDQNSARWPDHPLEPAIRSVFDFNPTFKPEEIDIVTCTEVIGNIFEVASSTPRSFRFDMEKVGNTFFMVKRERTSNEKLEEIYGFSDALPKENTIWGPNQRIIRYKLGGLSLLVRFEADAYLSNMILGTTEPFEIIGRDAVIDDGDTSVQATEARNEAESPKLMIHQAGSIIPQEAVCDIKVSYENGAGDLFNQIQHLWACQIKNCVTAYRCKNRQFDGNPTVKDLGIHIARWENGNKPTVSLMVAILKRLIAEAKEADFGKVEVHRIWSGPLITRGQAGQPREALPADLKARWEANNTGQEQGVSIADGWQIIDREVGNLPFEQ
ncbi:hypothetical protein LOZ12_000403 [Ophidiomyces ophidiicola]|uniref:Uncharacterized protein n=1 Tax=Ophidiomyces ophidiicola TaxID=1387563 RepID=A0ACB8UWH1_9EURO|nr:hypothetical protein LOZ64_002257 [Ophidiomyces ophidiicola]KAI1955259.1 hypothetical protein LOZ62_000385 [Ophidiomyces ophidiicola]KAI1967410.1 hypothetical protein LOZ59_000780 [Ophidiomyces ophidiicola]KAI1974737.1 hypothetical protein LOZ56_001037 [Ophidiomyces ophidiicola]KAI2012320.1 hypothetical protein LOZ50_000241 [Ophidiomyces ophidiicola]